MTATFRTAKKFLMWIGNLLLILLTEQILLPMLEDSLKNIKHDKSEYCSSWGKKLRRKNVSIDDDKKRENQSVENSLMEKVKIKLIFDG